MLVFLQPNTTQLGLSVVNGFLQTADRNGLGNKELASLIEIIHAEPVKVA
jgi:hypothetical protein